jgi:hypothetical protein
MNSKGLIGRFQDSIRLLSERDCSISLCRNVVKAPRTRWERREKGQLARPRPHRMLASVIEGTGDSLGAAPFVGAHHLRAHRHVAKQLPSDSGIDAAAERFEIDTRGHPAAGLLTRLGRATRGDVTADV